ncbi:MAG TPA: HAEPLYID family protein [Ohtaekwangia sp.]
MKRIFLLICLSVLAAITTTAQTEHDINETKDSLYIEEFENQKTPDKVLHAEPLYIDLIRDLGARKGEKEWNVGLGLTDKGTYDEYTALVEYEWAPVNRLGLEVELPCLLYYPTTENETAPGSKLSSLKLAAQYSFYVSEKNKTSMALGYIQEFELTEFKQYGEGDFHTGNIYNPFLVVAKRWGSNFHTMIYTGPAITQHFADESVHTSWQINPSFHYMISGTGSFIGVEFNQTVEDGDFDMIIRPQMRVEIADNLLIGIVTGIPISRENERLSTFLRLIYEPGHEERSD